MIHSPTRPSHEASAARTSAQASATPTFASVTVTGVRVTVVHIGGPSVKAVHWTSYRLRRSGPLATRRMRITVEPYATVDEAQRVPVRSETSPDSRHSVESQIIADLSHPFGMLVFMAAAEPNDDPYDEPNDHIVSKGWQKSFANDTHQVAVVDTATCQVVQRDRPIKNNFAERGFMTQIGPNGEALRNADRVFQKIERRVLNKVREIAVDHYVTDEHRDAVVQLFTIHLVRSQAFRDSQFSLLDRVEPEFVRDYPRSPEVLEKYQRHFGRLPFPGEVEAIVMQWFATQRAGGVVFDSIKHSIDTIDRVLRKWHLQVVQSPTSLPGFILGDVPVIHASLQARKFGFRDGLAVGDADVIMAPIGRRVMVCFAPHEKRPTTLTTKQSVRTLNALTIRVARQEVACHPDDGADVQRACRSINSDLASGPDLVVKARPR